MKPWKRGAVKLQPFAYCVPTMHGVFVSLGFRKEAFGCAAIGHSREYNHITNSNPNSGPFRAKCCIFKLIVSSIN